MELGTLERRIVFAEKRVLACQARVIELKEKASALVKRLEREARSQEEIKKEWIKKRNLEEERVKIAMAELKKTHRHVIEDLRLKYERERANKLRELKILIQEEECELKDWQRKKAEAMMKTKSDEAQIKARYQDRINLMLREQQSALRTGVVRQKRILMEGVTNVYSMNLERNKPTGMKKRSLRGSKLF